ncbi:HEAT repeat domain-containing protein [bacterium]|nr:HEAT repeat domain-containing protein [bacterium]
MKTIQYISSFLLVILALTSNANADDRSKLIEKLSKQLVKSKKVEERADAAKMLGDMKAKEAVVPLASALKDPDEDVRWNAAYSLVEISPDAKEAIPALKEALKDSSGHVRLNTAAALHKMGTAKEELIAPIRELLQSSDPLMRVKAADFLLSYDVAVKDVLPVLLQAINNPDVKTQETAAEVFSSLDEMPKEALPAVLQALPSVNAKTRENLIRAISTMGLTAASAVPALTEALHDRDSSVRDKAATALGKIGPGAKKAIGSLIDVANKDPESFVRASAIRSLYEIDVDDHAVLSVFIMALKDKEERVRDEALEAFRQMASLSPDAIAALKEVAANDPVETLRHHAQIRLDDAKRGGHLSATKVETSGIRAEIAPLLKQLNKELGDNEASFKSGPEAKQYLHDRNIAVNKDEFWSNLTQGYKDVTEAMLMLGMSPNTAPTGGAINSPILFTTSACNQPGEAQIALILLLYGADPNVTDDINRTPILAAAEYCPAEVVKALLLSGTKTNVVSNGGFTVLAAAVQSGRAEVVQMILKSGYKIANEPSYLYQSASGKPEIQRLLQQAGVKK